MKKVLSALLAAALIFSLAACGKGQHGGDEQDGLPGNAELSEPASDLSEESNVPSPPPRGTGPSRLGPQPPVLKIHDSSCMGIEANVGTYSWTYNNWDGTWTSVEADSSHPLERQEFLTPMTTADATVELYFDVQPEKFTVRCWSDACWGMMDTLEGAAQWEGNTLELREGGYIYEVIAEWTGEDLTSGGTVSYAFYVVRDLHLHMSALRPETVEDPVSGFCGNTMTTVHLDGQDYAFAGSDSVSLTAILINLQYDPNKICNCMPEFSVSTEDGTKYGVNLSECYVRCDDGQADLTVEQIHRVREILENQT